MEEMLEAAPFTVSSSFFQKTPLLPKRVSFSSIVDLAASFMAKEYCSSDFDDTVHLLSVLTSAAIA
eukprot:scaffold556438_cov15-Prasinocladus_malaysianus.AAC.1